MNESVNLKKVHVFTGVETLGRFDVWGMEINYLVKLV